MSDPRETLANGEVAHVALRGQVNAARHVEGTQLRVARPVSGLVAAPGAARLERQLLLGEPFLAIDSIRGAAFGRAELSGYVGWLPEADLAAWAEPTHRVAARVTFGFAGADIKIPDPVPLSFGSRLSVTGREGRFLVTDTGLFVPADHLAPVASLEPDPVAVALRFLEVPYLWGGNSAFGIDCSGLVQLALRACGVPCPGDSDQQAARVGSLLAPGSAMRPADLLFWKGHVAMLADPETLVHATGHYMAVVREPLESALARIPDPVLAHRRFWPLP